MTGSDDKGPTPAEEETKAQTAHDKTIIQLRSATASAWEQNIKPGETKTSETSADPTSPKEVEPSSIDPGPLDSDTPDSKRVSDPVTEHKEHETGELIDAATVDKDTLPKPGLGPSIEAKPKPVIPVQQQYASLLASLERRLEDHPGGHDLLSVLRMLEGQTAPVNSAGGNNQSNPGDGPTTPPRIGKSRRLAEDIVRFGQDPSNEFAPSTIERVQRDVKGGLVVIERFLGLLGPQGALPAPLTDEAIMRGLRGEDSFPRFLDVFNNRFIQLFFRAWADARPIVQHDRPDDDRFLSYFGSAVGIGTPFYRNLDTIDDRLKLHYAGLMSPKAKSATRLKALISGTFGVRIDIEQFVGTWLHLDPDDQLSLGGYGPGGAGSLGRDTIVGAKVYSVSDKLRIRIYTRDLDEYRKFLPPTRTRANPWTEKLFDLIDFYLGLELEYEIELALPKRCASSVRMDETGSATLGHIGWLKTQDAAPSPEDETESEELLTDTRFRPIRRHTTVYQ